MSRASATLPRAAASSGRLRGVLFCDAGDGGWPVVDAVGHPVSDDANALTVLDPIGEPVDFTTGEPLDDFTIGEPVQRTVAVSDRRDRRGDRRHGNACAKSDTRP